MSVLTPHGDHRNISAGRFCLEMMMFFHTWPVTAQILIIFSIASCNGFKFNARPTFTQKKITFSFRIMNLWHPIYCRYIWQIIVLTRRFLERFGGDESHLKIFIIQVFFISLNIYYVNMFLWKFSQLQLIYTRKLSCWG